MHTCCEIQPLSVLPFRNAGKTACNVVNNNSGVALFLHVTTTIHQLHDEPGEFTYKWADCSHRRWLIGLRRGASVSLFWHQRWVSWPRRRKTQQMNSDTQRPQTRACSLAAARFGGCWKGEGVLAIIKLKRCNGWSSGEQSHLSSSWHHYPNFFLRTQAFFS